MVFNARVKIGMRFFLMFIAALAPAQILPADAQLDAVVIGSGGTFYVAGGIGADLPATPGAFQPNPPTGCVASTGSLCAGFVAKVAPGGKSLMWATYFGAAGYSTGTALAVGPNGNLYIARSSTQDPQLPLRGYQSAAANMFVAELSADSGALLAGTYFGGLGSGTSQSDAIAALRLDSTGNVYLAGTARSANFPTTPGAYQRQPVPGETSCGGLTGPSSDGFVAKFDAGLGKLIVSTLVGSESHQTAADLAIGADGSLYVAGTKGSLTRVCNNPTLTRLTANGGAAIYSVTIPAVGYGGYSLVVDGAGSALSRRRQPRVSAAMEGRHLEDRHGRQRRGNAGHRGFDRLTVCFGRWHRSARGGFDRCARHHRGFDSAVRTSGSLVFPIHQLRRPAGCVYARCRVCRLSARGTSVAGQLRAGGGELRLHELRIYQRGSVRDSAGRPARARDGNVRGQRSKLRRGRAGTGRDHLAVREQDRPGNPGCRQIRQRREPGVVLGGSAGIRGRAARAAVVRGAEPDQPDRAIRHSGRTRAHPSNCDGTGAW